MAEQDTQQAPQGAITSAFPGPPPFWKHFTAENVACMVDLRGKNPLGGAGDVLPARLDDLPEDLVNLQPPPEPLGGTWRVFGDQYTLDDKLPSLEDQGIERLVPEHLGSKDGDKEGKHGDRAFELKRLAKSLLLNFLELLGVLSVAPEQAREKIQDLSTLLINFHHILNEYRPHQARESAIGMMQARLDQTRAETAAIRADIDKAKQVLEGLGSIDMPPMPSSLGEYDVVPGEALSEAAMEKAKKKRKEESWRTADEQFGMRA